ncbi:alpha/beta-hydrolase [Acephala macrosclerotiorum]|nr:alpha/beta-hydrolase [Acephala macrosclerotiorum]
MSCTFIRSPEHPAFDVPHISYMEDRFPLQIFDGLGICRGSVSAFYSPCYLIFIFTMLDCTSSRFWHCAFLLSRRHPLSVQYSNLNFTDDANHVGFLLLDEFQRRDAPSAYAVFNEKLLSKATIEAHQSDISQSLAYLAFAERALPIQAYYIYDGTVSYSTISNSLNFISLPLSFVELPVLCTQPSTQNESYNSYATPVNQVEVASAGIGETISATAYGPQCTQSGSGNENCLFLNIQTPYIPKQGDKSDLRPVMFWIHGGGFTGGPGAESLSDGGNLASREDAVVVNINYRLSTLGFLVIPGTNVTGNYGIADQITALEWTIKNIASFGGDPNQITINGESAGAGSIRTLLGSPPAIGKYQGAVAMSNLGGSIDIRINGDYATTYNSYYTVNESYAVAGQQIFKAAGCKQTALDDQIACLKAVPALKLVGLSTVARYVVQDGHFVNTEENVANDGASFSTYPETPITSELAGIEASLRISSTYAQSIIDSDLFPYYNTKNVALDSFNVSQRVATDIQFRCIDQATMYAASESDAFASSYYYQMDRSINGYDPNNLSGPPKTPGYPTGNPNLPYFKLHGSDMP